MARTAIATDSNSGITQSQAKELGVFVLPMPFFMRGKIQFEDIDLTQEQFYEILAEDAAVSTSQPSPGDLMDFWNKILEEYDDIVYIPMSSGLSTSCDTATVLSEDYEGKVQVVNNQRISVTQQQSVLDAKKMANRGVQQRISQSNSGRGCAGCKYLYYGRYVKIPEKRRPRYAGSSHDRNRFKYQTGADDPGREA